MSSDDYQLQNMFTYSRKSYNKSYRDTETGVDSPRFNNLEVIMNENKKNGIFSTVGCGCVVDSEGEIANILHKKCPVITLAQQQLQQLLDETDRLLCENTRRCRSIHEFLSLCKNVLLRQNKLQCFLFALIAIAFIVGIIFGAATCGTLYGRFNSPILHCIDNFFIPITRSSGKATYFSIT